VGEFRGRARFADIREGNLQAYWPEGNVLIERRYDPVSHEPDYNAVVEIVLGCVAAERHGDVVEEITVK